MTHKIIAMGWDVGGWMGKNHGVAFCSYEPKTNTIEWNGRPTEIEIPKNGNLSLQHLLNAAGDPFTLEDLNDGRMIIGVDAPLGYPKAFKQFINGDIPPVEKPEKEIHNPLAYRYTDQVIYETLGKKPLSAVFDRLGNNTTVAMSHTKLWKKHNDFKIYPMDKQDTEDNKIIIEVYPALVKTSKTSDAYANIRQYLPHGINPGTDAYDACICALYALAFGGSESPLPKLVHPPTHVKDLVKEEGWIYYFHR